MERRILRYDIPAPKPPGDEDRVSLEIVRGRARRKLRPVAVRAFLIGSAGDCDLVLGDSRFPEVHAYLLRNQPQVTIRWLGVGPVLMVNGRAAVDSEPLADGDAIQTGPYEFRIRIEPQAALAVDRVSPIGKSSRSGH